MALAPADRSDVLATCGTVAEVRAEIQARRGGARERRGRSSRFMFSKDRAEVEAVAMMKRLLEHLELMMEHGVQLAEDVAQQLAESFFLVGAHLSDLDPREK
jgi:hypothetical protein